MIQHNHTRKPPDFELGNKKRSYRTINVFLGRATYVRGYTLFANSEDWEGYGNKEVINLQGIIIPDF